MAKEKPHHIIIVPGLGDDIFMTTLWTKKWSNPEYNIEIWSAHWADKNDSYQQKYQRLLKHIKLLNKKGFKVSLIGISAGAGLVGNLFIQNPRLLHKMINICGRLRTKNTGLPTLDIITFRINSFIKSIKEFEKKSQNLNPKILKRIMTFSGMYDELVPVSTIPLAGAENRYIPFVGHNICIVLTLLIFRSKILDFIKF